MFKILRQNTNVIKITSYIHNRNVDNKRIFLNLCAKGNNFPKTNCINYNFVCKKALLKSITIKKEQLKNTSFASIKM